MTGHGHVEPIDMLRELSLDAGHSGSMTSGSSVALIAANYYRELLRRYIDYVGEMEGVSFLSSDYPTEPPLIREDRAIVERFTPDDWEVLTTLAGGGS